MKKFLVGISVFLSIVMVVLFQAFPAHAANSAVGVTWTADDVREVNTATPGTQKAFLGTRLQGLTTTGATTLAAGDNLNASGKCVTGTAGFATPTTTVFLKTTGGSTGESYCLGNAVIPGTSTNTTPTPGYNQRLTVVLVTDGGKDFVITPLTKTGFSNIVMDDAKDSVTLRYINDTVGWTIEGNAGATIN